MPITINVNIDLIDKERFFKGKKGRYMDLVLIETPQSEYGDYLVKQRGDRDEKMPILGNGKYFAPKGKGKSKSAPDDSNGGAGDPSDPW